MEIFGANDAPWMNHPDRPCATRNPEDYFPNENHAVRAAKEACRDRDTGALCPVATECLAYALEHEVHGIWGGTSDAQRRNARIAHNSNPCAAPDCGNRARHTYCSTSCKMRVYYQQRKARGAA